MFFFRLLVAASVTFALPNRQHYASRPTAPTKNGTYAGVYSAGYDQDFFLGIPYAQPPIGDLRFRNPQSLESSWDDAKYASQYSPACIGYGPSQMGYNISEDCLYLNIIRPAGTSPQSKLPVVVWIHGGGFVQGSGVDLRYNMSFIVQQSQEMGEPIIAITINYRLSAFGFLQGQENENNEQTGSNWGFRDQRLALRWIQENIQGFGGDPEKVTIWGQSAGAASVGMHLLAYNGRDDNLFRAAIMESGNPIFISGMNRSYTSLYNNFTQQAGCANTTDSLQCLRDLPFSKLNRVLNSTTFSGAWFPQIDGDIIARHSSDQIAEGAFVKVPIISGANADEGVDFAPKGLNTTEQFLQALTTGSSPMNKTFAEKILATYPLQSPENDLANLGPPDFVPPAYPYGLQYRRITSYFTDQTFVANRRLTCQTWAARSLPAYCFNFNAIPAWAGSFDGARHFVEVAFAMKNLEGVGYLPVRRPPFEGLSKGYRELATLMSGDWVSFIARQDPNGWDREGVMKSVQGEVPAWERYAKNSSKVFLYQGNATNGMDADTWREEGMRLINRVNKDVYDR